MAVPVLESKLHVPKQRRSLVSRPRLTQRLNRRADAALTLLSAPAGFGKTTLLSEWLASESARADGPAVAWVSLDAGDNDPVLFWTYCLTALQTAAPGVAARALSLLESAQTPIEAILGTLLNDLDALPGDVVLVLDDYHVIEALDVQEGMAFLVEHLPPQVRLVIATRADPALPLARLRGRGRLVELRAADLRFRPDEAAAYLNEVMGLTLTAADVATLDERTEGWIAALQLAALSMEGREDVAGFIAGFAGNDRYIVDYLAQEVLARLPERVRNFLLQTSILGRFNGSLCEAVTGQDDGAAALDALDRGNLFLVRLDDRRQWYRYHHLFADVLHAHLLGEESVDVRELHRRASDWYERNGERSEAIDHALAAEDFERAAGLVELALPDLRRSRQDATLWSWLEALPEEVFPVRPVLSIGYVSSRMGVGSLDGVDRRLRDAEGWLDTTEGQGPRPPSAEMVVVDEEEFRRLPSAISMYRAGQALILGDVAGTMTHAQRALELAVPEDFPGRGSAAALLGLAYWTSGNLDAAHRWYADGLASLERAGHRADVVGSAMALADIRIAQGRLREAMRTCEQALQRAPERGGPVPRGTADLHVGMSECWLERNDVAAARRHLLSGQELGEHAGSPQNRYRRRVAMARVLAAEGDLDGALDLLDEAERLYVGNFFPNVRPVAAVRTTVWLVQGRWSEALGWAREQGLSADDDLSFLHEFEHITLARVLVARYQEDRDEASIEKAARLLERLLAAAEAGARTGSVLQILVVQALAQQARGDRTAALLALHRALVLAEAEGYVRLFVDEGAPMATLLTAVGKGHTASGYVRRLLAAFPETPPGTPLDQGLIDPLSARELDVLRLLRTDLDGPGIARELIVSLNTVRTHTKNIYAKLGVNNRRTAVRRAEELELMSRSGDRSRRVPAHNR
jgi:LuxR family maltose regulon positive regulatory protein